MQRLVEGGLEPAPAGEDPRALWQRSIESARAVLSQTQTQELPTVTANGSIQESRLQAAAQQPSGLALGWRVQQAWRR